MSETDNRLEEYTSLFEKEKSWMDTRFLNALFIEVRAHAVRDCLFYGVKYDPKDGVKRRFCMDVVNSAGRHFQIGITLDISEEVDKMQYLNELDNKKINEGE